MPVIALSQLNRAGRGARRQAAADGRPARVGRHRAGRRRDHVPLPPCVYDPKNADEREAEVIIGKQRNGPTGTVPLTFFAEYTRFENRAAGRSRLSRPRSTSCNHGSRGSVPDPRFGGVRAVARRFGGIGGGRDGADDRHGVGAGGAHRRNRRRGDAADGDQRQRAARRARRRSAATPCTGSGFALAARWRRSGRRRDSRLPPAATAASSCADVVGREADHRVAGRGSRGRRRAAGRPAPGARRRRRPGGRRRRGR